jgi:hypothetical protein
LPRDTPEFFNQLQHFAFLLLVVNASAESIQLQISAMSVQCDPGRLELRLTPSGQGEFVFSSDWPKEECVVGLVKSAERASWKLPNQHLTANLRLKRESLFVEFTADEAGTLIWPMCAQGANVRV